MNNPSATSVSIWSYRKIIETMARLSCIVAIIGIALICVFAQEYYNDQYDNTDVLVILADDTKRNQYYNCFIDVGPCTPDAQFFKDILPESITTDCKKCTDKQKEMLRQITDWYTKNEPDNWSIIIAKSEAVKKSADR